MAEPVIFHVDLDAFFAAVEQRDNPALKGKPVVVGADPKKGRGRGVVSTCSYEARRYGIHSAMPISQAYRLCPQAIFLPVNGEKYHRVSQSVFAVFEKFTPDIEPVSIDEAFLDMTGSYHFYLTPRGAAARLKEKIKQEVGLTASVGIAPVKMVAKIASDISKPDGLVEVLPGKVLDFLWPLPLEKLWGVGPKTKTFLEQRGFKTIKDLATAHPDFLFGLLGEQGTHLQQLAQGVDPRAVKPDAEIKSVSHEYTFERDTQDRRVLEEMLLSLSEQVSRRLRKAGLKGKTLTLKVRLHGFRTFNRSHTFPDHTNFTDDIFQQARVLLGEFLDSAEPIRLIGVRMSHFHLPYMQENLFLDDQNARKEKVHAVVDKIKDKFGEGAIFRARGAG